MSTEMPRDKGLEQEGEEWFIGLSVWYDTIKGLTCCFCSHVVF